ncbi:unnamed protein product [Lactuca saligna]|uniref:MULE transposase domain-containing protein n=1 Tax=Lactuca saligna TaxID=75948 RepID=A0AA35V9M0_LACSI|nr:unnamed protein product [Lactuca saligna]
MEVLKDDEGHYSKQYLNDDQDLQIFDDIPYEHEADDYILSLEKTMVMNSYTRCQGVKDAWIATCMRVIGVDGCFLKGTCRGQLLAAMSRDANYHIFLIAWVVVVVENKETWKGFLDLLLDDIEMGLGHCLTLILTHHKGLVEAIKERVLIAEH